MVLVIVDFWEEAPNYPEFYLECEGLQYEFSMNDTTCEYFNFTLRRFRLVVLHGRAQDTANCRLLPSFYSPHLSLRQISI